MIFEEGKVYIERMSKKEGRFEGLIFAITQKFLQPKSTLLFGRDFFKMEEISKISTSKNQRKVVSLFILVVVEIVVEPNL